ncbi:MAG: YfiR family protein [Desulfamplus sp.]|nr:YfiR family protein [Desulfamplus sp.]
MLITLLKKALNYRPEVFHYRLALSVIVISLFLHVESGLIKSEAIAQEPSRHEIQAAMIIKFTDFIEWPPESFNEASDYFTIAILGKNEYEGLFEPFKNRKFYGKELKIIYFKDVDKIYTDIENIGKVQILIVSSSEKKRIKPLLSKLSGRPVLTIGDFPGFAENGGIINFFKKANNRIGFEINMESKESSGIKISSHLLRLGKIVHTTGNASGHQGDGMEKVSPGIKSIE